jgi:hypothetical protein
MQVTSETTVAAPIETVWDKLSNHAGMSGWAPGITVTLDKPGTTDPNGVGAVRRIASPGPGQDVLEEVVTFQPHMCSATRPCPEVHSRVTRARYASTPAGAGNHISYTVSSTASFPFDDAHKAADYLRSSQAIGKIVLEMKEQS